MTPGIGKIVFIIGGSKSGKTGFALAQASSHQGKKAYIATAEALDEEMHERIKRHRSERGVLWDTHEEPLNIADVLREIDGQYRAIVIDCLTLWLSNVMHSSADIEHETEKFIDILRNKKKGSHIYIVSNEVGTGIVPGNELAREFRDLAGIMNQQVAKASDEVFMVAAGIPIKIKG